MQVFGRDAVLRTCAGALADAGAGRGRILLLTGEAGIGKTTVAQEVATRAGTVGALTRWSACPDGGSVPFAPWIDLLRWPGGDGCEPVAEQLADEAEETGSDPAAVATVRRKTFERVCDALRVAARHRPQVAILEDLHWADPSSLLLLRALSAQVSTMPVLLIGTYRDDEVPAEHPLWSLGGSVERIGLERLGADDVHRLLAEVLAREPSAVEVEAVRARTGGNPLFVAHVARLLAAGAQLGVPAGVRSILDRRLARLPGPCHDALGVAAVLGAEFAPATVAGVLGCAETDVLDALDHAATARIALPVPQRADRWAFTHALLQEARYEALGSAQRTSLHRKACEILAAEGRVPARTLAQHAFRGRFDADDPRPAEYALAAATEARARLAAEEATELYAGAIARAPVGEAGDDLRARAWVGLGDARLRAGDGAGAAAAFESAAALARDRGDPDLLARAALGFGAGLGGFEVRLLDHRQTAMLESAAVALPAGSPMRPWVLARLSVALSFTGNERRRLALAEEALALARAGSDAAAVGAALASRCDAIAGPAHSRERLGLSEEIIGIGVGGADRRLELLGRRLRVVALAELCDLAALDAEIIEYERTAALLGDPLYSWFVPLWRGMRALGQGRVAEARRLKDEAAAVGALAGSINARILSAVLELFIALETEIGPTCRAQFDALTVEFPELQMDSGAPMSVHLDALMDAPGWPQRARAVLAGLDRMAVDAEWLATIAPLVELIVLLDRADLADELPAFDVAAAAADLYRRFGPCTGLGVVEGIAAFHRGPADGYLMTVAAWAGEAAAAMEHLERALVQAEPCGALLLAGTRQRAAAVLRRLGTQPERAADLDRAARTAFADLGLPARARFSSAEPRRAPASPSAAALLREGDAWAVTWAGRTVRIKHAKGVADLAVLLVRPGREVHVRELEGAADSSTVSVQAALDPTAVAAYRRRVQDIEAELDEADRHADLGRAERLGAERDAIVAELAAAFGLGGRARTVGPDPDERRRKAVSGRIKATLDRLEALHPALGRHLRNSIRTGVWCSYVPEQPMSWVIRADPL